LTRIADRSYRRDGPDEPWNASDTPTLRVPSHLWDVADRRAARIVGTDVIDGRPTTVLSFYGEDELGAVPLWFRLWVDNDDVVRRAEMRAPGHFMDHTYCDFDTPMTVEAPDLG